MADSDSFINEVTEEVRRDQLFAFFRKWAWAFVLAFLVLVGGAGYNEYRQSQQTARAEAFGDAVIDALEGETPTDRIAALEAIGAEDTGAEMLLALMIAGQEAEAGDAEGAASTLRAVAERSDMPERYRDLAFLKAHMLAPGDAAEAAVILDRLARPGAPYRALAIEQQAYMLISDGDVDGGIELLQDLLVDASATPGLQDRARQLIVALQSGASLVDEPLPEPDLDVPPGLVDLPVGVELPAPDAGDAPEEGGAETQTEEEADAPTPSEEEE